jgi:probable rRNA maturation factor
VSEPPSLERVVAVDEQSDVDVDLDRLARFAADVLDAEGVDPSLELTLSFVDRDVIAALKAEHLDGDGAPTDVLAFPIDDEPTPGLPGLLGDVVVCPAVAAAQADGNRGMRSTHDGTLDAELALLVVHGVLHLLGHDHSGPDDTAAMRAREEHHLRRRTVAT